ncbi:MAG TPA: S9 family peptidase [Phycisphaerales bacterium]|nr:S9 family peptidase [Phycisphaerales bacterium]
MQTSRNCGTGLLLVIAAGCGSATVSSATYGEESLIPRRVFFSNPDHFRVMVSPDGTMISYVAPADGVLNVWVQTIGTSNARPVTHSKSIPVIEYWWAQNSDQILYGQDSGGDENVHIYAVSTDGHSEKDLTPYDHVRAELIASESQFPDEVLIGLNSRVESLHDVWRVNTRTGEGTMVLANDGNYTAFTADAGLNVRAASRLEKDGRLTTMMRDSEGGDWYELAQWPMEDSDTSGVLGFSRDGKSLYMLDSRGSNTGGLFEYRMGGPNGSEYTQVASDPEAEIGRVLFDPLTGRPQALMTEYLRRNWRVLDHHLDADFKYLKDTIRGDLAIDSRDESGTKWIVSSLIDNGPVAYYFYDATRKIATFLFTNRSQLEHVKLANMKPVIITARDGLKMVSYLTTPIGKEKAKSPMVLLVHGGPWARDSWEYNRMHQWLANRGYAVLSVNFRGSSGFGKAFLNAGNREWAGAMHTDLIDAVNWAVSEGVADPDKVAIMGGSYGGYATLVGLTFTPNFFAAGVDIVGPSHVRTLLESIPPYWEPLRAKFDMRVGSLEDGSHLDSISPLTRVSEIKKPLLIGQGKNDPRVKAAESEQIVTAMQEKGLPVTYVLFPDEGHGFRKSANNMAFFAITEVFLAEHLGGRTEGIGSDVRESSAEIKAGAELIPGLAEATK